MMQLAVGNKMELLSLALLALACSVCGFSLRLQRTSLGWNNSSPIDGCYKRQENQALVTDERQQGLAYALCSQRLQEAWVKAKTL